MTAQANRVIAVISPRSVGGLSIFDGGEATTPENYQQFQSEDSDVRSTVNELQRLGLTIENVSDMTISFSGTTKQFQSIFGVKTHKEKVEMIEGIPPVEFF